MINFACPACGKAFDVKEEFAGRRTKCRGCGESIQVPAATTTAGIPVATFAPPASDGNFFEGAPTARKPAKSLIRARFLAAVAGGAAFVLVLGTTALALWGLFSNPSSDFPKAAVQRREKAPAKPDEPVEESAAKKRKEFLERYKDALKPSAQEFLAAYQKNPLAGDERYKGKLVAVTVFPKQ